MKLAAILILTLLSVQSIEANTPLSKATILEAFLQGLPASRFSAESESVDGKTPLQEVAALLAAVDGHTYLTDSEDSVPRKRLGARLDAKCEEKNASEYICSLNFANVGGACWFNFNLVKEQGTLKVKGNTVDRSCAG
jgi:hypothetical protein